MHIPIFPLPNLVFFPKVVVSLHIFEDRYKLMINRCIDTEEVFGIVLLGGAAAGESEESEATIHRVGVTARVVQVERLEDGRLNILCAGESRFRIRSFTGSQPYWSASVDVFEDDEESAELLDSRYRDVVRLYRKATELSGKLREVEVSEPVLPESPLALSFMISYVLDLDPPRKQELLETTSTLDRLLSLTLTLEETIAEMEHQIARKGIAAKVRSNGHIRN